VPFSSFFSFLQAQNRVEFLNYFCRAFVLFIQNNPAKADAQRILPFIRQNSTQKLHLPPRAGHILGLICGAHAYMAHVMRI